MINVEKLIREGKTMDEITEMLYAESEKVNKKIAKEKEAAKAREIKDAQLKDAMKQAEAALQAVYDLSDGGISVYVQDGKVTVQGRRRFKYDKFWNDFFNIVD